MKGGELEVNKIKTFPAVEKGGENESPVLKHRAFSHARRHQSGAPAGWPGTQAPKGPALRRSASSKPPRRPWRGQGSPGPIQALGEPQEVVCADAVVAAELLQVTGWELMLPALILGPLNMVYPQSGGEGPLAFVMVGPGGYDAVYQVHGLSSLLADMLLTFYPRSAKV